LSFVHFFLAHFHKFSNKSLWPPITELRRTVCLSSSYGSNSLTKASACPVSSRLANKNPVILVLPSCADIYNVSSPSSFKSCIRFPYCFKTALVGSDLDNSPSIKTLINRYSVSRSIFCNIKSSVCFEMFDSFVKWVTKKSAT